MRRFQSIPNQNKQVYIRRIPRQCIITREIVDEIVSNQLKHIDILPNPTQTPYTHVTHVTHVTEDEIKEICLSIIEEKKIAQEKVIYVDQLTEEKNLINATFTDEEPVKLLTIDLKKEEEHFRAFTIKLYLNIFVDDEKNVSTKYVECIWSGVKRKDDDYFLTNIDVMYTTSSIKTSSLSLDIGNVQFSTSYNQLYAIIDILPTIKGSKIGTIKGYYEIIKQNENMNVFC